MSRAFKQFLEELHANGPRKKDGFDEQNLGKLHFEERSQARQLLRVAILSGDDTAVHGLVALDRNEAWPVLQDLLETPLVRADEWVSVRIANELAKAGQRIPAVDATLAPLLFSKSVVVRQQAIDTAKHLPSSTHRVALLKEYLLRGNEDDALNRRAAARVVLDTVGRASADGQNPPYAELLADLAGDANACAHAFDVMNR